MQNGEYNIIENGISEKADDSLFTSDNEETALPAVTAPPVNEETAATVVPTDVVRVVVTTVTEEEVSPAKTVPEYEGRYRVKALSEREAFMNSYTTTAATTTTTTTTTVKFVSKKTYEGIDVSRYQGDIDWKKVKASGIDFVMIRAGYGMEDDQVDLKFHDNIKGAQVAGLDCGIYWYSYAMNTKEALREAKLCHKTIDGYKLTYPVAFDIEDPSQKSLSKKEMTDIVDTFCGYMEKQGYYVTIYSYASILNDRLNSSLYDKYDVWVAHTGVSKPSFSRSYGMWQYSWKGSIKGIKGDVDQDHSYVSYPEIIRKYKLNGFK